MDGSLSPMIATADKPVAAIDSVDGYDLWSPVSDPIEAEMYRSFARFGSLPSDSPALAQVRRATAQTDKLRQDLGGVGDFTSPVAYPDNYFAHKLAGLAAYIAVGLPMRVVTIRAAGGYDTHSDQAEDLERNLRETCEGLLAFQRDLEARGLADRVLIEMWSEFGRRPEENGSAGTDHGAAGCAFVIGSQSEGRDGRRVPRPGETRRQRQPARDQRLPRHVLLAARAVARPRRRPDHPRRLRLRPADAGEGVSGRPRGRSRLALAPDRGARAGARRSRLGGDAPAAADCTWKRHSKRVVKHVKRHGKRAAGRAHQALVDLRRRSRPPRAGHAAGADSRTAPRRRPNPNRKPTAIGVSADDDTRKLHALAPDVSAGEVIVELNNQGEDPHNLNLQRRGRSGEPTARSAKPRPGEQPESTASTCRRAPTGSGAASRPRTKKAWTRDCVDASEVR